MHLDLTTFRTIISDWLDEREQIEDCNCDMIEDGCFFNLSEEEKAEERAASFCEKIKMVLWQLRQQGKEDGVLKVAIRFWMLNIYPMANRAARESFLFDLIEDYFNGQGYKTREP